MTAHITHFRAGEVVLLLEPKGEDVEAELGDVEARLKEAGVTCSGRGERVMVRRGQTAHVLQTLYVDGRQTGQPPLVPLPAAETFSQIYPAMQAVVDAVKTLNGPPGEREQRPIIETDSFTTIASSPNWLANPLF